MNLSQSSGVFSLSLILHFWILSERYLFLTVISSDPPFPLPSLDNLRIKLGFPNQDKIPDSIWAFSWYSHSLSPNDPPQLWWWIVKSRFTLNIKDWAPRCLMMRGSRGGKTEIVFTKQSRARAESLIIMEDVLSHSDDNAFSLVGTNITIIIQSASPASRALPAYWAGQKHRKCSRLGL